jgi:hypothetical protein
VYEKETELLATCKTAREKVQRYDQIITALENIIINGGDNLDVGEYSLDDGQTKIRRTFRGPNELFDAIEKFMRLRNRAVRNVVGGVYQLRNVEQIKRGYGNY